MLSPKPKLNLVDASVSPNETTINQEQAIILSKIAMAHGVAVPVHRFEMLSINQMGASIQGLSPSEKIKEAWLTIFPEGEAYHVQENLSQFNLPAIFIHHNANHIFLLKGLLADGTITAEDVQGKNTNLKPEALKLGELIVLRPKIQVSNTSQKTPKTAKEWFYYAIRQRKAPFVEGMVATGVVSILSLVASFYTMQVYDRVAPTQSYSTLYVITIGALIAIVMELITKHLRSKIMDHACKQIDLELSGVFFGRMLAIRMDARPKSVGTFANQIKQFEVVRSFMTSSTLFILGDLPFVVFFILMIWMIGGVLAIVPLILLPISIFSGLHARRKIAHLAQDQQQEANQKNGLLIEAIDGIEAIKSLGGEWKMLEQWQKLSSTTADKELIIRSTTTLATSLTQTIQQISYVLMIGVGVYAIGSGSITMGALMACSIISNRALSPISLIAGFIVQWEHAKIALKGLDDMMKLPVDRNENERMVIPERCQSLIRAEKTSFAYIEDRFVLSDLSVTIRPGDRIAIIGPVGSGKSTLIKLLSGLFKPSKGKVFLDEVDMAHIAPEFLRESIGYLTQDIRLFSGSLRYNLTIGLSSPTDSQIIDACVKTGLDSVVKNHPKGLELPIFEGGRGLSGGQRQLVGLTRMLIARPQLLLLDEPTASMDGDLEMKVMKGIFEATAPDSVIVLSTHKTGLLSFVNRVILIDKGKVVLDGPRDEVIAKLSSLPMKSSSAKPEKIA